MIRDVIYFVLTMTPLFNAFAEQLQYLEFRASEFFSLLFKLYAPFETEVCCIKTNDCIGNYCSELCVIVRWDKAIDVREYSSSRDGYAIRQFSGPFRRNHFEQRP